MVEGLSGAAMKSVGWRYDSVRHSLASRGISTGLIFIFRFFYN